MESHPDKRFSSKFRAALVQNHSGSATPYSHDHVLSLSSSALVYGTFFACCDREFKDIMASPRNSDITEKYGQFGEGNKIVSCVEYVKGNGNVKRKINFNSFHTQEAAAILGILYEDCIIKPKEELVSEDPLSELRYERHCKKVTENIKSIYHLRLDLIKKERIKKEEQQMDQKRGSAPSIFRSQLLAKSLESPRKSRKVKPVVMKHLKDYAAKVLKEISTIESPIKKQSVQVSPRENFKEKLKFATSPKSQRRTSASPLSSGGDFTPSSPQPDPLEIQVKNRKENIHKIAARIAQDLQKEKMKRDKIEKDYFQATAKLEQINRKLLLAEERMTRERNSKLISILHSERNAVEAIRDKLRDKEEERFVKALKQYLGNAKKRLKGAAERKRLQEELVETMRVKGNKKWAKHVSELDKAKAESATKCKEYEDAISTKYNRKHLVTTSRKWKDIDQLNKEAQNENMHRLNRAREYNRSKVISTHTKYQEKFDKAKETYQMYQCNVRSQSVKNNCELEEAFEYLQNLKKCDPYKSDQKNKLIEEIAGLNKKLGLGLNL